MKDRTSAEFDPALHWDYTITLIYNRLHMLKARLSKSTPSQGEGGAIASSTALTTATASQDRSSPSSTVLVPCRAPPRNVAQPWMYYEDNTVLGAEYVDVERVLNEKELLGHLQHTQYDPTDCATVGVRFNSPAAHRIVVVFYFVQWIKAFGRVASRVNDMATQFEMVKFVHVEADAIKWTPAADGGHQAEIDAIEDFPAFAVYRHGKRLARTKGGEQDLTTIATVVQQTITGMDRQLHTVQQKRVDKEEQKRAGAEGAGGAGGGADEQIPWIWDEENKGERLVMSNNGFTAKFPLSSEDSAGTHRAVWKWEATGGMKPFDSLSSADIERWVRTLKENDTEGTLEIDGGVMHAQVSGQRDGCAACLPGCLLVPG